MKCPYCGEELKEWDRRLYCENMTCSANHEDLPQFIWQDLIDGKKARQQLRTVKDRCVKKVKAKEREITNYLNGISVRQSENERLAKQLRQAHDALESIYKILILDSTDRPFILTPAGKNEIKRLITEAAEQDTKE